MIVQWAHRRPEPCWTRGSFAVLGRVGLSLGLGLGLAACAPTADDSKLPPEVQDPKALHTPAGALELYRAALLQLPGAVDQVVVTDAILTDELAAMPTPPGVAGVYTGLDSRADPEPAGTEPYNRLHRVRAQVREARGFLSAYSTDTAMARARQGHLYAMEGYADVLLADLFCSGIPLSTVDFQGDYTLRPGSSTREVYRTAVGLFDSALALLQAPVPDSALAPDSVLLFRQLAAVGKGRALLALGDYAGAAQAVTPTAVPTAFRYQLLALFPVVRSFTDNHPAGGNGGASGYSYVPGVPGVGLNEGLNGLDYVDLADRDPRVGGTLLGTGLYFGAPYYFPANYALSGPVQLTLADGVEARLIETEAALQAGSGDWLTILNALRTDGTFEEQPTADPNDDPAATDTIWHPGPGTGLPVGLAPLADPGTTEGRVDLLFRERAFWLYLTAHRQGDLRRLLRQYGRAAESVYPTGPYPGATGAYGTAVVVPVPASERQLNPLYTGCGPGF